VAFDVKDNAFGKAVESAAVRLQVEPVFVAYSVAGCPEAVLVQRSTQLVGTVKGNLVMAWLKVGTKVMAARNQIFFMIDTDGLVESEIFDNAVIRFVVFHHHGSACHFGGQCGIEEQSLIVNRSHGAIKDNPSGKQCSGRWIAC
jgi:hypothetical protein